MKDLKCNLLAGKHVLLIDDEEGFRYVIEAYLEYMGAEKIYHATDGLDALALLNATYTKIDLVVSDENMPNLNGSQVLSALRDKSSPFRDIPFVLISGLLNPTELEKRFIKSLGSGFLEKPFSYRDMQLLFEQMYRSSIIFP